MERTVPHEEAPVESGRGAAIYPLGGDDHLVRHFIGAWSFPSANKLHRTFPDQQFLRVDVGAFKGGTSHPGALLEECNVDATRIRSRPLPNGYPGVRVI